MTATRTPFATIEEAIDACESASPQSRVCVLSAQHRSRTMQRALSAKAAAYVLKDTAPATIIETSVAVRAGTSKPPGSLR